MTDFSAKFDLDRRCLRQLRKIGLEPQHFFDVGACNGAWTRHVRLDFPEATFDMFEPLADHAPALRERLEETQDGTRCRLHKVALGPETKRTTMYMFPENLPGSTALELGAVPEGGKAVEVDMLAIDEAIEKLGLPLPQLIKMDTQGCELNILKGARRTLPKVDVLLLECWLTRAYGQTTPLLLEVADWLREFDFHFWDLADQWRDPAGNLVAQDCFFLSARCKHSTLQAEPRRWSELQPPARSMRQGSGWRQTLDKLFRRTTPDNTHVSR